MQCSCHVLGDFFYVTGEVRVVIGVSHINEVNSYSSLVNTKVGECLLVFVPGV